MKNILAAVVVGLVVLAAGAILFNGHVALPRMIGAGGGSGLQFYYTSATTATTSVATTWSATPVLSADNTRAYVSFCNESTSAGQAIYLGMGATSSGVSGIKIAANSCYEMNNSNMFVGNIYAIGSSTANTLLMVTGKY